MLVGRIVALRRHGALSFFELRRGDDTTRIRIDPASRHEPHDSPGLRVGDIVEVAGDWESDRRGDARLYARLVRLHARAGRPAWSSSTPQPTPELERSLRASWPRVLRLVRSTLEGRGHVELLTPTLNRYFVGGTSAPMMTEVRGGKLLYLRVTSEIALKGHVAQRLEPVYEIGPQYRNTQRGLWRSPEFISMEAYAPFRDIGYARSLVENLIRESIIAIDPNAADPKCTEHDAGCLLWPGMDEDEQRTKMLDASCTMSDLARACRKRLPAGLAAVVRLPAEISPLYRRCEGDPQRAERTWLCLDGVPIADMGEEETSAECLRQQLEQQRTRHARHRIAEQHATSDEELAAVLDSGLPPLVGMSLSLSRLVAMGVRAHSIHDTHMPARPWRRASPLPESV